MHTAAKRGGVDPGSGRQRTADPPADTAPGKRQALAMFGNVLQIHQLTRRLVSARRWP